MKKIPVLLCLIFLLNSFAMAQYEDSETVELQKIIITPNRFSQVFNDSTGEITIITKEDLKDIGAQTILDVFRPIKGITVKDYYGNGSRASVDIRGFGETSGNNVLVLVDGRRVNEIDLSGVDWNQIPLERVERIEILHGGTGAVLYGDNAVGGVINIITKTGKTKKAQFEISESAGSYAMHRQSISCDGIVKDLKYSFNATLRDTNGYRENSEYKSVDYGTKLENKINDSVKIKFSANFHDADLGLPGPLSTVDLLTLDRRDSKSSEENNNASEKDWYAKIGLEGLTLDIGTIDIDLGYRSRVTDTYWWGFFVPSQNSSRIDTFSFTPNYTFTMDLFTRPNKLIAGLDFYRVDSIINDFNLNTGTQTGDSDVDKQTIGFYINDSFNLTDKLWIDLGYRYEDIGYEFDYVDYGGVFLGVDDSEKRKEEAFKIGGVYSFNPDTQAFINASKSFRSPLTEEFLVYDFSSWPFGRNINKGLSTQSSLGFEGGIRHAFKDTFKIDLAIFNMLVNNEIYYDAVNFVNANYEKTRHQGFDMQSNFKINKHISSFANYLYTKAVFKGGQYSKNYIPMVAKHKINLGLNLGFWKNFKAIPMLSYTGKRYMINDPSNQAGRLDGYLTFDIRTSWENKNLKVFFDAYNILNELYSEYAVTNSTASSRNYYPSPERNFMGGITLKF